MAQASAVSATAAAAGDEDDIGARISRLGLPAKPNVIGKASPHPSCSHHQGHCFCNVYTTMLDRADFPNIPESPDREVCGDGVLISTSNRGSAKPFGALSSAVPKANPGKRLSLSQYRKMAAVNGSGQKESKSPANGEKRPIERITPDAVVERKVYRRKGEADREEIRDSRERASNPPKRQTSPPVLPLSPPAKEQNPVVRQLLVKDIAPVRDTPPAKETPSVKEPPSLREQPPSLSVKEQPPLAEKPRPTATRLPPPPPPLPPPLPPPPPPLPKLTLPPMMSPTLPAILEEALLIAAARPLPPLSPTLPPVLEEALALTLESPKTSRAGNGATKRESSIDISITVKQPKMPPPAADKSAKKTVSVGAKKTTASRVTVSPTKPPTSPHLKVPGEPKKQLSLKKVVTESASVPVGRIKKREVSPSPAKRASSPAMTAKSCSGGHEEPPEDDISDTEPKLSRIVKLKFRHLKWRYENFVKLTKNSKEKVAESEKRPASDVAGKSTVKRVRETEDRGRTPVPKKIKTETLFADAKTESNASKTRSTVSKNIEVLPLPIKKEKGSADRVVLRKSEARNGATPQVKIEAGRTSTPTQVKKEIKQEGETKPIQGRSRKVSGSQAPLQLDPVMNAKAEAFTKEQLKYQDFGRKCKYEAEGKIESDKVAKDERYCKLLFLDSVLCYIIAFLCEEESNAIKGAKPNLDSWRSSLPFVHAVSGRCKEVPQLYGLGKLLEAVILQHLLTLDTDRFEKVPLPDTTPLTPEIGVSLTPNPHASLNTGTHARDHFVTLKNQLIKLIRETRSAWTEANQYLTVDELQRFSKTWEKRTSKPSIDRHRIRHPGSYKSDFTLPLHVNSSLLEAVNFGCSFLAEWSNEAGLTLWESRVKL